MKPLRTKTQKPLFKVVLNYNGYTMRAFVHARDENQAWWLARRRFAKQSQLTERALEYYHLSGDHRAITIEGGRKCE